jgi:hypothetical protein
MLIAAEDRRERGDSPVDEADQAGLDHLQQQLAVVGAPPAGDCLRGSHDVIIANRLK